MDLLSQYKQQNPEAFREQPQPLDGGPPQEENGFFLRLVMRLSGGKIRDAKEVRFILLLCIGVFVIASVIILWSQGGQRTPTSGEIKEMSQKMGGFHATNSQVPLR